MNWEKHLHQMLCCTLSRLSVCLLSLLLFSPKRLLRESGLLQSCHRSPRAGAESSVLLCHSWLLHTLQTTTDSPVPLLLRGQVTLSASGGFPPFLLSLRYTGSSVASHMRQSVRVPFYWLWEQKQVKLLPFFQLLGALHIHLPCSPTSRRFCQHISLSGHSGNKSWLQVVLKSNRASWSCWTTASLWEQRALRERRGLQELLKLVSPPKHMLH